MKGNKDALFASNRPDWETPRELIRAIERSWILDGGKFVVDAAAQEHNAICKRFYGDAFVKPWSKKANIWCNPPYGRTDTIGTDAWLQQGADAITEEEERLNQRYRIVYLLPARTDTKWSQKWADGPADVALLPGRLTFHASKKWKDPKTGTVYPPVLNPDAAPFPSCLFLFPSRGYGIFRWDWRAWMKSISAIK